MSAATDRARGAGVREPSTGPVRVVHAGALALLAAALGAVAVRGVAEPGVALAFTVLIALGECVRITLPGDREQAPIGAAGALAYALLGPLRGLPTAHGVLQVVAVTGVGLLL
ncbi:HD-GYP domain-containing protein, partial [Kitasatospora sp. NPDC001574]